MPPPQWHPTYTMKISYASAMTKVKLNGNAPTSYAPSAKAKVTLFGSTTMHKP